MRPTLERLETRDCPAVFSRIPAVVDWGQRVADFRMMLNDQLGDCTSAVVGHIYQVWNERDRRPWVPSDDDIKTFYFNTSVNHQDMGAYTSSVISWWAGNGIAGHRIVRKAFLNVRQQERLRAAIYATGGGVYVGLDLPATAIEQFNAGQPWTTVTTTEAGAPGSAGGHAVELVGYDKLNNIFKAVTWGEEIVVSGDFINNYGREAWAVAGPDLFEGGRAFNGMTVRQVNMWFDAIATV